MMEFALPRLFARVADLRSFAILLICAYWSFAQDINDGFMPGSAPSYPNLALSMCQQQAPSKGIGVRRAGIQAEHVNKWCNIYEGVLPCLGRTLPTARSANDWFLKLIYNETMATKMSKSICEKFPEVSNLSCAEGSMTNVTQCMKWTTSTAIKQFNALFKPGLRLTTERKNLASIYACIISVATAGCFHRELKSCSLPQRKLMYDYYIMLSGKCREIAGLPETTTSAMMTTSAGMFPNNSSSTGTGGSMTTIPQPDIGRQQDGGNSACVVTSTVLKLFGGVLVTLLML